MQSELKNDLLEPVLIPTDPKTGYEIIFPGKCLPPPGFILKQLNKRKAYVPNNRIIRFFWKFFGEGF